MATTAESLGQRIREARDAHGVKQGEAAAELGIAQSKLSRWELGKSAPRPDELAAFADRFGVSVDWLLGRQGSRGLSATVPNATHTLDPDGVMYRVADRAAEAPIVAELTGAVPSEGWAAGDVLICEVQPSAYADGDVVVVETTRTKGLDARVVDRRAAGVTLLVSLDGASPAVQLEEPFNRIVAKAVIRYSGVRQRRTADRALN